MSMLTLRPYALWSGSLVEPREETQLAYRAFAGDQYAADALLRSVCQALDVPAATVKPDWMLINTFLFSESFEGKEQSPEASQQ